MFEKMIEKIIENRYKKRYETQKKINARQSEQIESLKSEIEKLKLGCEEKDKVINSIEPLRSELKQNVDEIKGYKEEYKKLIAELKRMKTIMDKKLYKGRWWLVRFLIK